MPFRKIEEPKKKSAYVAEQIVSAIQRGEFSEGDKLPSERELAEQMRVSRNSLREALSALQISGILETRTGAGTFVKTAEKTDIDIGGLLRLVKGSEDLLKIWEARREIETTLAKLAIDRATPRSIKNVSNELKRMRKAVRNNDVEGYLAANEAFHLAIAECADNPPLKDALRALQSFTNRELLDDVNIGYVIEGMEKTLQEHEDILTAIRTGDVDTVEKAIKAHFSELEEYFENKYLKS